jgi:hypothetical protein
MIGFLRFIFIVILALQPLQLLAQTEQATIRGHVVLPSGYPTGKPTTGLVMGGGAEMKVQRLRLAPEFRNLYRSNDSQNSTIVIPSNQFEFLVGLRYRFGF